MTPTLDLVADLRTAHSRGERPSAPSADLGGADLQDADLRYADLRYADLGGADLRDANLRYADLGGADLRDANLRGANLRDANLRGADLRDADLRGADLRGADLRRAGIVSLGETPSGWSCVYPTPAGWCMQVGCWRGSPDELRALASDLDRDWPSRCDRAERERRAPYLLAILVHVDLITAEMSDLVPALAAKWGSS